MDSQVELIKYSKILYNTLYTTILPEKIFFCSSGSLKLVKYGFKGFSRNFAYHGPKLLSSAQK